MAATPHVARLGEARLQVAFQTRIAVFYLCHLAYRGLSETVVHAAMPHFARLGEEVDAVLDAGAEPAAVGAAVMRDDWVMILCMATHARARRQGHAARILWSLANWACEPAQNRRLFLQVEDDNSPAMALYHLAGFQPAHTYYYRTQNTNAPNDA